MAYGDLLVVNGVCNKKRGLSNDSPLLLFFLLNFIEYFCEELFELHGATVTFAGFAYRDRFRLYFFVADDQQIRDLAQFSFAYLRYRELLHPYVPVVIIKSGPHQANAFSLFSFTSVVNMSHAWSGLRPLCTISLTVLIMETGLSDWKMFLPMSTPTAPLVTAL